MTVNENELFDIVHYTLMNYSDFGMEKEEVKSEILEIMSDDRFKSWEDRTTYKSDTVLFSMTDEKLSDIVGELCDRTYQENCMLGVVFDEVVEKMKNNG
jgi:hypothetical protein